MPVADGQNTVATYVFDGQGRRIKKTIGNDTFDHYYNTGHQLLEVRKNADTDPLEQYVWGIDYIDSAVLRFRDSNTDGTVDDTLYVLHDANFNVTALIDASGDAQERYTYTPYGMRMVLDGSFGARGSSSYAWTLGHQGLMHDSDTALIYNRARMLHPALGRFMQRDPLGYVDGGDLYQYVQSSPTNYVDHGGLLRIGTHIEFAGDATWRDKLHHALPGTGSWYYTTDLDNAIYWVNREVFIMGDRFRTPLKFDPDSTSDDRCSYCFDYVTISSHGSTGSIGLGSKKYPSGRADDIDLTRASFSTLNKNKALGQQLPAIAFLSAVKAKLCRNGTIRFVSCYSSTLSQQLSDFFGPGYRVLTYEGKVTWGLFGAYGIQREGAWDPPEGIWEYRPYYPERPVWAPGLP